MTLPLVRVTRYVTPLREGGSLPGVVEGDDLGTYVCKFRGAGQGLPVLVSEVIVAGIARALGLRVPRLVRLDLSADLARYEADEEVQDLLRASVGVNLGVDLLPGAFGIDPTVVVDPAQAARIVWLDAFVANVDRSWRNPNLLVWHGDVWLIDHGACLYFHHAWGSGVGDATRFATTPYDARDHIFAAHVADVAAVDAECAELLSTEVLQAAVDAVPDEWLPAMIAPSTVREAYVDHLRQRLAHRTAWLPGAEAEAL